MKRENVIDLTGYFMEIQERSHPTVQRPSFWERALCGIGRFVETAVTAIMGICVCVCTLLFFTML